MIYMIIAGYFEDDDSDELTHDPVFKAVLNKDALASQPTVQCGQLSVNLRSIEKSFEKILFLE